MCFTTVTNGLCSPYAWSYTRPLPKYGDRFWSPIKPVDVEPLKKGEARASKLVPTICHKWYQRRLADHGFLTLEQRMLRGLLIETFKILRGFSEVYPASMFELFVNRTRNHGHKLVPPSFNTVLNRDFPTVRVCNLLTLHCTHYCATYLKNILHFFWGRKTNKNGINESLLKKFQK